MNQPNSITSVYAPPFKIVAKYFITAIISFVLLNLLLLSNYTQFSGFHFRPIIMALTHVATLGWITMIIFGALFQLIPVVLEVKLYSEKLAEIQFWIFSIGIIGFVYSILNFGSGEIIIISAAILNLAMLIFSYNSIATLLKVNKWNLTGFYLASAIFYFFVTAIAGLLMAVNLVFPFVKINHLNYLNLHVHIAFIGWVTMVIMGVSFKLIPMFTLSHGYSLTSGKWALVIINIGLLGLSTVMHYQNTITLFYLFSILIAIGIYIFLFQISIIFKNRLRKKFDIGIKFSITAYLMLAVVTLLGLLISFIDYEKINNLSLIYGYLIVFGFVSFLIVGQMYKIVPFLVWYHKYSSKVGFEKVPLLKEMFNENYAHIGFYLMLTALIGSISSLAFNLSMGVMFSFSIMFLSSLIFLFNMITIFRK
ncbi:MAG: cbb3-type cytochrome c oxidase subunit I [Ignavibacteriales bacterium]|nr:cbb3-type cytochrome c oxidase subunit I [Ignavibacteriota bacterium]MCB9247761.1 cbb3-type cytochrome c oxidase subunit I [Ignavibacteriales bacterium]